jgi:uncharacterized protein (TIRG00374 family)
MTEKSRSILSQFNPGRAIWPIVFGLSIVWYVIYSDLSTSDFSIGHALGKIRWSGSTLGWLVLALVMMVVRTFAYMWQLRCLTERRLSWRACLEIMLLWEFFAAVTPSVVGGAAAAVFMLVKERIGFGKSAAIVFTIIFLDDVFYLMILPVVSLFVDHSEIFAPLRGKSDVIGASMIAGFWSAYTITLVYIVFLMFSLFIWPQRVNRWLKRIFMLPVMKRWRRPGIAMANELLLSSRELRDKSTFFWLRAWAATALAWTSRYMILNCVLAAFAPTPLGWHEHLLTFSRQAVLFMLMVVAPTPGSSGVAEAGFSWLFWDMTPAGLALMLAVLWRLISYYPYLIIGVPVMTHWVKRVYGSDVRT